jgi:hypothetical protein
MRPSNTTVIPAGTTATTSQTSKVLDAGFVISASFQINSTNNTNAGTLQVQASNDPVSTLTSGIPNTGQPSPSNWVNIGSAATVTAGASAMVSIPSQTYAGYRWLRCVWTPTSGAGTITVNGYTLGF